MKLMKRSAGFGDEGLKRSTMNFMLFMVDCSLLRTGAVYPTGNF